MEHCEQSTPMATKEISHYWIESTKGFKRLGRSRQALPSLNVWVTVTKITKKIGKCKIDTDSKQTLVESKKCINKNKKKYNCVVAVTIMKTCQRRAKTKLWPN